MMQTRNVFSQHKAKPMNPLLDQHHYYLQSRRHRLVNIKMMMWRYTLSYTLILVVLICGLVPRHYYYRGKSSKKLELHKSRCGNYRYLINRYGSSLLYMRGCSNICQFLKQTAWQDRWIFMVILEQYAAANGQLLPLQFTPHFVCTPL